MMSPMRIPLFLEVQENQERHMGFAVVLFLFLFFFVFVFVFVFCLFRVTPTTYGGSQARGPIRALAAGLHHGHSNAGSKLCLQPAPQLTATPDP